MADKLSGDLQAMAEHTGDKKNLRKTAEVYSSKTVRAGKSG